jgi:hypothetical protein
VKVGAVGRRACSDVLDNLLERGGAGGRPEADGRRGEVNVVGKVVPGAWLELGRPLGRAAYQPAEGVVRAGAAREGSVLELREVALHG